MPPMNATDLNSSGSKAPPEVSEADGASISLVGRRFAGLDVLRFVAAVLIVYLHTTGATSLQYTNRATRIAVPFFTASAVLLAFLTGLKARRTLGTYAWARVTRVYVPFVVWVGVYYLVAVAGTFVKNGGRFPGGIPEGIPGVEWWWLIHGNAHHIWFLPFICVVSIAVFAAARWLPQRPVAARLVAVGLLVLGGVTAVWPAPAWVNAAGYIAFLGYDTSPAWFWVLAVLLWMSAAGRMAVPRWWTAWPAWVLLAAVVVLQAVFGRIDALENVAGVLLLVVGLGAWLERVGAGWRGWLVLGGWAYGVYLAHVLFVETLQDVVAMAGLRETAVVTLAIFVASLAGSLVMCAVLSRWRFGGYLGVEMVPAGKPQAGQTSQRMTKLE